MKITPESWVDVRGFNGKYQVNMFGQCRRMFKTTSKLMTPFRRKGDTRHVFFKLTPDGEKCKDHIASRVIYEAFYGEIPKGMCVYHKNGIPTDNELCNLKLMSKTEVGKKTGHISNCKSVVKLDSNGDIVDYYRSTRSAAKANYLSYQTIADHCNGIVKKGPAIDGYEYAWEDVRSSIKLARGRIEKWNLTRKNGKQLSI